MLKEHIQLNVEQLRYLLAGEQGFEEERDRPDAVKY
jgi:hypothetical protein